MDRSFADLQRRFGYKNQQIAAILEARSWRTRWGKPNRSFCGSISTGAWGWKSTAATSHPVLVSSLPRVRSRSWTDRTGRRGSVGGAARQERHQLDRVRRTYARPLAEFLTAKSAQRRGEIAMRPAGSGPDSPSTAIFCYATGDRK